MYNNAIALILLLLLFTKSFTINNNVYRNNKSTFLSGIYSNVCSSRIKNIGAGWGIADNYVWQETDDFVTVKINLSLDIPSKSVQGNIYKDRLDFYTVDGKKLICGNTIVILNQFRNQLTFMVLSGILLHMISTRN